MALTMATAPLLVYPVLVVTAPWTLFMVIRRWNAPRSLIPRTRIRLYLAVLFALAEISFIVLLIYMITRIGLPRS